MKPRLLILGAALALSLSAGGAPIAGWQPWVNVTGYDPSYTYVPLNPDHTWKADFLTAQSRVAPRGFRMMDINQTVASPLVNWSDRPLTDFGPTGASYETTANLAVETGKPLWLNIPAMATPDYAFKMGQFFGSHIPKTVTGNRIEYGNEFWNGGDQRQGTWNLRQAQANPAFAAYSDTEKMSRQAAVTGLALVDAYRAGWASTGRTDPLTWEWGGFSPNPYWTLWGMDELSKRGRAPSTLNVRNSIAIYDTGSPTDVPIDGSESPAQMLSKLEGFADVNAQWAASNQAMALALGMGGTDVYEGRFGTSGGIVSGPVLAEWLNFQNTPEQQALQQYGWREIVATLGIDAAINLEGLGGIPFSQFGQFSLLDYPSQFPNGTSQSLQGVQSLVDFGSVPEPDARWVLALTAVVAWLASRGGPRGKSA